MLTLRKTPLRRYIPFRRRKFGNVETEYRGVLYRSRSEANYAIFLDSEKQKGRIKSWRYEVAIPLHVKGGKKVGDYIVDFLILYPDDHQEFHEIKGVATSIWRWKWKHAKLEYPHRRFKLVWSKNWS